MSKYSKSVDGVERQTVVIRIRLTREDVKYLTKIAKKKGKKSYKDVVDEYGAFFFDWLSDEADAL